MSLTRLPKRVNKSISTNKTKRVRVGYARKMQKSLYLERHCKQKSKRLDRWQHGWKATRTWTNWKKCRMMFVSSSQPVDSMRMRRWLNRKNSSVSKSLRMRKNARLSRPRNNSGLGYKSKKWSSVWRPNQYTSALKNFWKLKKTRSETWLIAKPIEGLKSLSNKTSMQKWRPS